MEQAEGSMMMNQEQPQKSTGIFGGLFGSSKVSKAPARKSKQSDAYSA
jgi:hypothetical protein